VKPPPPPKIQELLRLAGLGKLQADDLLWKPGFETWKEARSIPGPKRADALFAHTCFGKHKSNMSI